VLLDVPMGEVPCVTYGLTPFSRGMAEITYSIQKKTKTGGVEVLGMRLGQVHFIGAPYQGTSWNSHMTVFMREKHV